VSRHRSPTQTSVRDGLKHTFVNLLFAAALGWIAYTGQASIGHSGAVIHLPVWIRVPLGLASLGIILHESTVVWMTRRRPRRNR
jgi:hypothetical protein